MKKKNDLKSNMQALELATFGHYTAEFEAGLAKYEANLAKVRAATIRDTTIFLSCCLLAPVVIIVLTRLGF